MSKLVKMVKTNEEIRLKADIRIAGNRNNKLNFLLANRALN